jgi:hypothetical protein
MHSKINRRTFISQASCGIGAVAFSSNNMPFMYASSARSKTGESGKLLATTDYIDNVIKNKCLFSRENLDQLHKYLSSIGVKRHQWQYNPIWSFYGGNQHGFDILSEAVASAHAHGLEFYTIIKPFEGGGYSVPLPLSLPFPDGAVAMRDICGIHPHAQTFIARHPHLCLKRKPGTYEFTGPVISIRLVKNDDLPTRIKPEHLSLLTSTGNNRFLQYKGPLSFRESTEWRPSFPKGKQCRILHFEGLMIPENHKYILVNCSIADNQYDFTNERGKIIELEGHDGKKIPSTLSAGPVDYNSLRDEHLQSLGSKFTPYFQLPEVQTELNDQEKWQEHFKDYYSFYDDYRSLGMITNPYTLDKEGYIAVVCGKREYMLGNLHPIYPEVRHHWLDMVRYCLDRGVDGVNFRHANHVRAAEYWNYGFNDPVIEAAGGKTDYASIMRINGDAYTQFLQEARDLIKSYGKSITVHLHPQMLVADDRGRLGTLPPNFEWQWEKWVKEIGDDFELRGTFTLRPWNLEIVADTFGSATRAANKPFYFQGSGKELSFRGPNQRTREELEFLRNYKGFDGFVLYETAAYTKMNEKAILEGSTDIEAVINEIFKKNVR